MNLTKSEFGSIWPKLIFQLLVVALAMKLIICCGPGRSGGRHRIQGKLKPLVFKQHVPNVPEKTLGASGPTEGQISRSDPRFKDLVPNYNADIIFKDEEGTGEDRLMTQRCKERLNTLAVSVMNLWPGVRLRVTESWDNEGLHHSDSLHYEGRAVDITTSDRDSSKYGMLARLAVEAGFDWVYYESRSHVHCSVKSESSQAAKSLGCFSGNMSVLLANGERKLMSQLEIGDSVQTLNSDGNLVFSPVLLFMHRSPEQRSTFLKITTKCGINITITPSHLILRWRRANVSSLYEAEPVYAKDVQVNEQLLITSHSLDRPLRVGRIVNIDVIPQSGVYAPLTETGTIVVNDVIASCYAVVYSQRLAHLAFAPVRLYYSVETSFSNFYSLITNSLLETKSRNTTVTARYVPQDGMHWYCKILQRVSYFFVPSSWMLEM